MEIILDTWVIMKRNLIRYTRVPQLIVFSTIQPVMFLLLFTYVFGGAIKSSTGQHEYIQFLLPGILVQTILFGAMMTGIGLVEDMARGIVDRFRSLPIARSAVLVGRTLADAFRNVFVVILMTLVGMLIGFRIENGFFNFLGAAGIIILFGFAFSWISATIGLAVKTVETAQSAGFIWVFPLAFASAIFVPVDTMPGWLQVFAKVNPVTAVASTVRALCLGTPVGDNLWHAAAWIVGILIVFVPLAVNRYRKFA